jgi:hypothetical protein
VSKSSTISAPVSASGDRTGGGETHGGGFAARPLPYRRPALGKDYWIKDDLLPNPSEVARRCLAKNAWTHGLPLREENWPGMRCPDALLACELRLIEDFVKEQTGAEKLWQSASPESGALSHNYAQLVGEADSGPRPHTDSRRLCRYAAVLYLTPDAPTRAGTSFYRLRLPDGRLGGNTCPHPHSNLCEALNVTSLPLSAWEEDVFVPNVFNRLLVYRSDIVHSATSYFGVEHESKRLTAVFFWMA